MAAAFMLIGLLACGGGVPPTDLDALVRAGHSKVVASRDADNRALEMRALVRSLSGSRSGGIPLISKASVDHLIAILAMDGDVGAFYGAQALAAVACGSQSALPYLRDVLGRMEPVRSDFEPIIISPAVSPAEEIQIAIRKIEQCPEAPSRDGTHGLLAPVDTDPW